MKVCGIIAEYDPFHKGHLHQFERAKALTGADYMVCVLGCAFSQRGEAMLFSTQDRALMALKNGFDLVLGMPFSFSCAQANRFAKGGVGILDSLGCVSHLSFGCESDNLDHLFKTARLLYQPSAAFSLMLKEGLAKGLSFAAAQGKALAACLPEVPQPLFPSPNFILGVSYLLELLALQSGIQPVPVKRDTAYHSGELQPLASAGAVRKAYLNREDYSQACPDASLEVINKAIPHRPEALDKALLYALLALPPETMRRLPEASEGLEIRVKAAARKAANRADIIDLVKTRRYPRTRIARLLAQALVGPGEVPHRPEYARLLGFHERARPLLKEISQHGFPLIGRPARAGGPGIQQDLRAEELWQIGAGKPAQGAWQQHMIIMR